MSAKVLVTGANGFVGGALCVALAGLYKVNGAVRKPSECCSIEGVQITPGELSGNFDWSDALVGVSVVVHCAARVHVMNEVFADPLAEFRRVNVDGTLRLGRQAAAAGVRRFVFISSIGVNGRETFDQPFFANDEAAPTTPYAISKHEAECSLRVLADETGMEVVIIRPPLVYGPGAKANVLAMMRWLWRGIPLPLGSVTENRRSLVFLDNLVSLVVTCVDHPAAANETFLVSDGEDLSTVDLLRRMSAALGRSARLVPVPPCLLKLGVKLFGLPGIAQRLCGSLQVDIGKTTELLGWVPHITVDEGFRRTAACFMFTE